jgi:hypothetical protein
VAVENSATASEQEAESLTNSGNPTFEGYLYLDSEGRPLSIQSDAEIESFLTEAEIIDERQIPTGITHPLKLTLKADGIETYAAFNDADIRRRNVTEEINGRSHFSFNWRDSYRYSIAAYRLDRLLGLYRVPPVVPRQTRGARGAISIWLAGTVTENQRELEFKADPPDLRRWNRQRLLLLIFDNLVANRDSKLSNLLIDANWRLWFIDCTRCFGKTEVLYYPLENVSHCERGMWVGLRGSSEREIREALAPYLSMAEMKALMARRGKIMWHFEKLIAEKGEAAVFYDVDPPSGTAPRAAE